MTGFPWTLARAPVAGDQHAAGRVAAARALELLLGHAPEIRRADDGAPECDGAVLSISHGRREAVAVAALAGQLGVDLTEPEDAPRVRRVAPRWCHAAELLLADADPLAFWALKEAGAKALRHALLDGGLKATRATSLDPPVLEGFSAVLIRGGDNTVAVVWR